MQIATGTVINGKIFVERLAVPEETVITVLAQHDEQSVRLSPAEEAELLDALDEADREEGVSAQELFARLQHQESKMSSEVEKFRRDLLESVKQMRRDQASVRTPQD